LKVLKFEPETRIDPAFAWRVQLEILGDPLPLASMIRERIAQIPTSSRWRRTMLAREIDALVRLHELARIDVSDDLIDDIARLATTTFPQSDVQGRAIATLGYLGPRARRAVPAVEHAQAVEQQRLARLNGCINMCGFHLESYVTALHCINMDQTIWAGGGSAGCRPRRVDY
jgi:hypothetical protein